jgi:hypothetical protein
LSPKETKLTDVVGTDLEGLVPPHDETDLFVVLVGEKTDISSSSLFPLELRLREPEQLGPPVLSAGGRGEAGWVRRLPRRRNRDVETHVLTS